MSITKSGVKQNNMKIYNPERRLRRFAGDVIASQNRDIIKLITGDSILEVGSGYGTLINQIKNEKPNISRITGIDNDITYIKMAKKLYNIDILSYSAYQMNFPNDSFDTVILRDSIHHLAENNKLQDAMHEIKRVCKKELIVFDPNPTRLVRLCRRFINHEDNEAALDFVLKTLEDNNFKAISCQWRDVIAHPLGGGFVSLELIPNIKFIKKWILTCDRFLNRVLAKLKLQHYFCWRYLIYAKKNDGQ